MRLVTSATRLASALDAPIPATGVGLRVASYVTSSPDDGSKVKLSGAVDGGEVDLDAFVRYLGAHDPLAPPALDRIHKDA